MTDNVPSWLLPIRQWPHCNWCTLAHVYVITWWSHDHMMYIMCPSAWVTMGSLADTTFIYIYIRIYYIYYVHLTSVGFKHSVCHESLLTRYIYRERERNNTGTINKWKICKSLYIFLYVILYVIFFKNILVKVTGSPRGDWTSLDWLITSA